MRIVLNDYLPKQKYRFVEDVDKIFTDIGGVYQHNNFDEMRYDVKPFEVMKNVYHSIKNLRKIPNFDITNRQLSENADLMRRTSLLAELEVYYIYVLNLNNAHVGKGSRYF